jgi:hypothetical protein
LTAISIEATDHGILLKRGSKSLVNFKTSVRFTADQEKLIAMLLTSAWACSKNECVYQLKQHVAKFDK